MSQHDTLTQAPADEVERIIRSAVAAMPNTNPLVADDLIAGHTMHTEAEDIVAIWRAALSATQPAQAEQCRTCNGHRLVGGHTQDGSGYGEPCPDCNSEQPAQAAQSEPVERADPEEIDRKQMREATARFVDRNRVQQAAQGAGEVVYQIKGDVFQCPHAWRDADEETFHMVTAKDRRIVYTTPSQPAPVVPDGWKLVPIKCTEAMKDVGGQFEFATIADGRLLAQSMWNELLLATPTPPAQAAADARDAERLDWLEQTHDGFYNIDRVSSIVGKGFFTQGGPVHGCASLRGAIDAALATHQQGGSK